MNEEPQPVVASVIGTYLKPEMQSVYRQITGLKRFRTIVLTENLQRPENFPFPDVIKMKKRSFRPRGNFIWRFYWKHMRKIWPPPGYIPPEAPEDFPFCDIIPLLKGHEARLLHIYYGHKAAKFLPLIRSKWRGPMIVSFHGVDLALDRHRENYRERLTELFDYARLILARSDSLLDLLRDLGCPEEKLRLNRTPVPLAHLVFSVRQPPEDGRWVFCQACRLIEKKGLLTALAAVEKVREKYPLVKFVIAGTGPQEEKLRLAVAEKNLGGAVELAGWCDQPKLRELFSRAHVFMHPSETTKDNDQEGVPNSMLEAMATGLPVVATWHGGIPEAMDHERDGLLVPERSPDALASALLRMIESPGLLSQCSKQARATVEDRYGADKQIARLEDCYAEAMEN